MSFTLLQAAKLAMERGWAINIGGGFHHCSSERGGGFCAYADITLGIKVSLQGGVRGGWAINIGGGFHHCSSERGGGFCAYADITLGIKDTT